jgi:carbon monoxide dehydrogenase subunit G
MSIDLKESFQVNAPVAAVWRFLLDPHQVVQCMPGAELDDVAGDGTFLGRIKVRVGPISTTYKGRVQFTLVDEESHNIQMTGEGLEAGGGTARGTMSSRLTELPGGQTEVIAESSAEITGRIAQFGRGMVQGVSQQLFQQFAQSVKARLESADAEAPAIDTPAGEKKAISVLPLVFGYVWSALCRLFRRLFRRTSGPEA